MEDVQANTTNKLFNVRAKKTFSHTSRTRSLKLYIHSCVEKESFADSLPLPSTINIHEGSKRKQKVEPPNVP
ncbi:hypothetical protein EJD97_011188 [Solanum chilense]|uniref:Uncharacterized protein n=1 Tax=Solanum chilense TaxID=4083 RepID=A0A6N2BGB1_SOLCI|nr:hypothetical protein EJD97_011188 [Solanum chilense]